MQSPAPTVVVLATGGTIAGTAPTPGDNIGYRAAQLGADALVAAVPGLAGSALETEQVAQVDSKDMDFAIWQRLAQRVAHHLARAEVAGVVITHGTDTLEETGYFLQRVLAPAKPVVLTAAMRPASALLRDGPQNLLDAVTVARTPGVRGTLVVVAGVVWDARELRKVHTYRLDAFAAGDAGWIARVEEGALRQQRPWPDGRALGLARIAAEPSAWPAVEILTSHAGAGGTLVRAAMAAGVRGLVVACTGNGTLHHALEAALREAQAAGVAVRRSSRCLAGAVLAKPGDVFPTAGTLTPVQARVELLLELLASP
ncbi:MAG: asparaginase [Piscinibacter sp.]|uniref:asparaginase n=1 Tax=Piscinibacter TaxID=1114981 RepID=UPI000FDE40E8|nr:MULTISPECIES: asparaginase [Piscinibacter]MCW5664498.1 asparaginase [Piscinibacter sp.]